MAAQKKMRWSRKQSAGYGRSYVWFGEQLLSTTPTVWAEAQIEQQKRIIQNNIETELQAKKAECEHAIDSAKKVPTLIAKQSLLLASKASISTTTDEDGHFTLSIPRGLKHLVVIASSEREVSLGNTETYFWIEPFESESEQSPSLDLNNNNELLTGEDGGRIVRYAPFDDSAYNLDIPSL